MKISVRTLNAQRVVEVTLQPSWLGRWFGHRVRRGIAIRGKHHGYHGGHHEPIGWFWEATGNWVGNDIEKYIECAPVEDLPKAVLT